MASIWLYHYTGDNAGTWDHLIPEYIYARTLTSDGEVLNTLQFFLDSNANPRSFDLDNVEVFGSRAPLPPIQVAITNLLFSENFSSYDPGTPPLTTDEGGLWGTASWTGTNGSWEVLEDIQDVFAQGTGNRFLQLSNTHNLTLVTPLFQPQEVLIYSFDFIGRIYADDGSRWVNIDARNETGAAHTTSLLMAMSQIRSSTGSYYYGPNDSPQRIITVVNNREGAIIYDRPDGQGTATLGAGQASVWIYYGLWENTIPEYSYARSANFPFGAAMDRVRIFMDSNPVWRSFDIDNFEVFGSIEPVPPPIVLTVAVAGGNIEIRWAGKAGKSYQVQQRGMLDSGDWSSFGDPIVTSGEGEQMVTDSIAGTARFYRVQESAAQ